MFCPNCGSEERQLSQFCRGCGMDLRVVRTGLERTEVTAISADAARNEIGRAIAEKIKEVGTGRELRRLTDHLLPQLDKFLESAEEKRLRRMRAGVITSAIGLGGVLMFMLIALASGREQLLGPAAVGLVVFIIGMGILINGKLLTIPKTRTSNPSDGKSEQDLYGELPKIASTGRKELDAPRGTPISVIEHTTHRLSTDPIAARNKQKPLKNKS